MNSPAESAIGTSNDIFPADDPSQSNNAVSHEFRVFQDIGGVANHAG